MSIFLDTNILIYAALAPLADDRKQALAQSLILRDDCVLSVQVINEFVVQSTRSQRTNRLSLDQAIGFVAPLRRFPIQVLDVALFDEAIRIHRQGGFSWWDATIVAAARAQGGDVLYSEDMQDGRIIDRMRIVNPFRD